MILLTSYLTAAAVTFGVLAYVSNARARQYELYLSNQYQRSFNDLVTAVEEVDSALQKSMYAMSQGLAGSLCTEVFGKAMAAQLSLGSLPFSSAELEQTASFLSRVGDYAYCLSRAAAWGRAISPEELENLKALSDTAAILALNLRGMQSELLAGALSLTQLRKSQTTLDELSEQMPGYAGDGLKLIEQEFPEVPSLIYDGPFSEHLTNRKPKVLEGLPEVSQEEARRIAADILATGRGRIHPEGELTGDIPCWCFSADGEDGAALSVCITRQGGKLLSLLSSRPAGSERVSPEEAVEAAKRFLQSIGCPDMEETYHMTRDGVLTVNFAYRQGETLCYSDLIKVSVALDSGKVCGCETKGWLTSHCQRELPAAAVSQEDARAMVPESLEILSSQLALVPSDGQYETLCHEFKCAAEDGRHFIIYVNAATGQQEKILILLEDETGTLTL